jgi:hypothetical protein
MVIWTGVASSVNFVMISQSCRAYMRRLNDVVWHSEVLGMIHTRLSSFLIIWRAIFSFALLDICTILCPENANIELLFFDPKHYACFDPYFKILLCIDDT